MCTQHTNHLSSCHVFHVQIWCMITMVIGGFFLSFCFGRMASIISRLDADKVRRAGTRS